MKTTQKSMGSQEEFKPSSQEEEEPNRRKPLPRPLPKPSPPSHEEEEPGFELTEELIDELIANPPHNDELIDEVYRHPLMHEEEEPKKFQLSFQFLSRYGSSPSRRNHSLPACVRSDVDL